MCKELEPLLKGVYQNVPFWNTLQSPSERMRPLVSLSRTTTYCGQA
jgi:hypothetical protein